MSIRMRIHSSNLDITELTGLVSKDKMIFPTHNGVLPSGSLLPDFEGLGFSLRDEDKVGIQFCFSFP